MIFTACPTCDEPQVFAWEPGDGSRWFPSRCRKCHSVMWAQATSIAGETLSSLEFQARIMKPGDEPEIEAAEASAEDQSTIVAEEGLLT